MLLIVVLKFSYIAQIDVILNVPCKLFKSHSHFLDKIQKKNLSSYIHKITPPLFIFKRLSTLCDFVIFSVIFSSFLRLTYHHNPADVMLNTTQPIKRHTTIIQKFVCSNLSVCRIKCLCFFMEML